MSCVFLQESRGVRAGCVGGLVLAVTRVVPRALSLSLCATYLFVAHLCCAEPDTGICQKWEKVNAGNWRTREKARRTRR